MRLLLVCHLAAAAGSAYRCLTDVDLGPVANAARKGLTLDDSTFRTCSSQIPAFWPNTWEPLRSVRLFKAWSPSWPHADRELVWDSFVRFAKTNNAKFLVGTQITCSQPEDAMDWHWAKQLLKRLGPDHVMGLAVGNEVELFSAKHDPSVTSECITSLWDGGQYWQRFTERVDEFDAIGFAGVPVTSVFGGSALGGEPFFEEPGKALVKSFLANASRTYNERYAFSFNFYSYFDPNIPLDIGTTSECKQAIRKGACWQRNCTIPEYVALARNKTQQLTGRSDYIFWVGEVGWSTPQSSTLSTQLARCKDWSSKDTFRAFYGGYLGWDLGIANARPPDHVFYFTMRDSKNFGLDEHFGLVEGCADTHCKLRSEGYTAPLRTPPTLAPTNSHTSLGFPTYCSVPSGLTADELAGLQQRNCRKVVEAGYELERIIGSGALGSLLMQALRIRPESLRSRRTEALQLCYKAKVQREDPLGNAHEAALLAVNAWALTMNGRTCCNLAQAPFCSRGPNASGQVLSYSLVLAGLLASLPAVLMCCLQWRLRLLQAASTPRSPASAATVAAWCAEMGSAATGTKHDELPRGALAAMPAVARRRPRLLTSELEAAWLDEDQGSPLRVLQGAVHWARSTADLFAALQETFGFQVDNVRNQHEHLLSLWRSHCAVLADRIGDANDASLLRRALGELHRELLESFHAWRARLCNCPGAHVPRRRFTPPAGGARWEPFAAPLMATEQEATWLVEITTYLLVWGEAGNLRFMPEAVYFLAELALAAEGPNAEGLYGCCAEDAGDESFLAWVVRPIYNAVFDEWYDRVDLEPAAGGNTAVDVPRLRPGYEHFLPPDCANYDDWNELFCDPDRLVKSLVTVDGDCFFDVSAGGPSHRGRFAALGSVDWPTSLAAPRTKTHREMHGVLGAWAATHRVWFLHELLFLTTWCLVASSEITRGGKAQLSFGHLEMRLAAVGLLIPLHTLAWLCVRELVTGAAIRQHGERLSAPHAACFLPAASYAALWLAAGVVRPCESALGIGCLLLHLAVSLVGACVLLCPPVSSRDALWELTRVSCWTWAARWLFWLAILATKFATGFVVVNRTDFAMHLLRFTRVWHVRPSDVLLELESPQFNSDLVECLMLWASTWLAYLADTQLWFTLGCALLAEAIFAWQRGFRLKSLVGWEDEVAEIPKRFFKLVLSHDMDLATMKVAQAKEPMGAAPFSRHFPVIWDRVVRYMLHEDKIDTNTAGDLSFFHSTERRLIPWPRLLREPLGDNTMEAQEQRVVVPDLFLPTTCLERFMRRRLGLLEQSGWPRNAEVQWRLEALARSLSLNLPEPYRSPHIPGITVLIPHHSEDIILSKEDLLGKSDNGSQVVPLISWLEARYPDEFRAFVSRMVSSARACGKEWPVAGRNWAVYTEEQWEDICLWASLRSQTLWRTVSGICLYYPALQCHHEVQADWRSPLARLGVWNPSDCFTCLVSMQRYASFSPTNLRHTSNMLQQFPGLCVAFIDYEEKHQGAGAGTLHPRQRRRYFSCLIDSSCTKLADGRRVPRLRIELPGYPILGDGKGDNQNHALPFARGAFVQCIDANQGAYFEQLLMLPCLLKEFSRDGPLGKESTKQIVGLPEHITSDLGSIGDFGASAEFAFGTVLQRSYAALGARMHYGHPDIMNKPLMMQQGGLSKATKTLNLSEDIFAGMDFTLRGQGRRIRHCEYMHVTKGRDLGFNTLLKFISKISSGNAELLISRQALRLGQLLPLPDFLTFFYAHSGFYVTQCLLTYSTPVLAALYLFVILNDCEPRIEIFDTCERNSGLPVNMQRVAAALTQFSFLFFLFLLASTVPLVAALCEQRGLPNALAHVVQQVITLSPVYFIFQSKIICSYTMSELRQGGAKYVNTGRGLPTQRRPFIGSLPEGGLFLDYAAHASYDGAHLLAIAVASVCFRGGWWGASVCWQLQLWLTALSWLLAPFLFNPFNFRGGYFLADVKAWLDLFCARNGVAWIEWYERTHLHRGGGVHLPLWALFTFCALTSLYTALNSKLHAFMVLSDPSRQLVSFVLVYGLAACPPLLLQLAYVALCCRSGADDAAEAEPFGSCSPRQEVSRSARVEKSGQTSTNLAAVTAGIVFLGLLEGLLSLWVLLAMGWGKACFLALILKYALLNILADLLEAVHASSGLGRAPRLWLYAHRMARDMAVSLLILTLLSPLFGLVALNDWLCAGCSLHNLLVYRRPGDPMQKAALIYRPQVGRARGYTRIFPRDGDTFTV